MGDVTRSDILAQYRADCDCDPVCDENCAEDYYALDNMAHDMAELTNRLAAAERERDEWVNRVEDAAFAMLPVPTRGFHVHDNGVIPPDVMQSIREIHYNHVGAMAALASVCLSHEVLRAQLAALTSDAAELCEAVEDFVAAQGTANEAYAYGFLVSALAMYNRLTAARDAAGGANG